MLGTKLQALLQQVVTPLAQNGFTDEHPSADAQATTAVDCVCVVVGEIAVAQLAHDRKMTAANNCIERILDGFLDVCVASFMMDSGRRRGVNLMYFTRMLSGA